MKTNCTAASSQHKCFIMLKSLWSNGPLNDVCLNELKTLAKKFNPKLAKYMKAHSELC